MLSELVTRNAGFPQKWGAPIQSFSGSAATWLTQQAHYELSQVVPTASSSGDCDSLDSNLCIEGATMQIL